MPRRSPQPRYRRRVVLELTPDESDLLDRLADSHGTIRGAVLVGLRALEADRSADLEAQLRGMTEQLATAERSAAQEHDRLAAELAAATDQVATSRRELKAAQAEHKATREDLREARAKVSNARGAAEAQRRALEARLVHHVFCGACGKFVPESEWAEQPDGQQGVYVYHKPDGFRPKPGLLQLPTVLFWRPSPSDESKP
jgi:DNA repair exonuclease SbcCD ATPase subunit